MKSFDGRVWAVETHPVGSELVEAAATSTSASAGTAQAGYTFAGVTTTEGPTRLVVVDASWCDADGGSLTVGGVLVDYSHIEPGFDTDTIVLTAPLTAAQVAAGARVEAFPAVVEKRALVSVDPGMDGVWVKVDQSLVPLLADGERGEGDDAEVVQVDELGGTLTVVDVYGPEALVDGGRVVVDDAGTRLPVALSGVQVAVDDLNNNVIPGMQDDISVAGGAFTGSVNEPTSADATGKPLNAVWNRYDGNRLIGSWLLVAGVWTPREPQTVHIDTGTFGELDGLRLKANSILTTSLAVTDFTNYAHNPDPLVPPAGASATQVGWELPVGATIVPITPANHPSNATGVLRVDSGASTASKSLINTVRARVRPGEQWIARVKYRTTGTPVGSTAFVRVYGRVHDQSGAAVTGGQFSTASLPVSVAWTTIQVAFMVPATGYTVTGFPWVTGVVSGVIVEFADFELVRQGAVLIDEGAVRALSTASGDEARMSGTFGFEHFIPVGTSDTGGAPEMVRVFRAGRGYSVQNPDDPTETWAALNEDGTSVAKSGAFSEALSLKGEDLSEKFDSVAQGMVVNERIASTQGPYGGSGFTGYYEFSFDCVGGRSYLLVVNHRYVCPGFDAQLRVWKTQTTPGGNPAAPLVTDAGFLTIGMPTGPSTFVDAHYMTRFVPAASEATKWLIGGRAMGTGQITFNNAFVLVYDMGPFTGIDTTGRLSLGGASATTGGATTTPDPTPTVKKYTGTYTMDWDQTYNQFGQVSYSRLRHGANAKVTNPFGAAMRMPNTARSLMIGATKINAYLRLTHTGPLSGGTVQVGRLTTSATSAPAQMPTVTAGLHSVVIPKGATKEFRVPLDWDASFIAGTNYGFALGNASSRFDLMEFARRTAGTETRPQLRLEVWK